MSPQVIYYRQSLITLAINITTFFKVTSSGYKYNCIDESPNIAELFNTYSFKLI